MHVSEFGLEFVAAQHVVPVFRKVLEPVEQAVSDAVTVPLTQGQFDALCSFALDNDEFATSTMLVKLNSGDAYGAAGQFLQHISTKDGVVSQALIRRRRAERSLFIGDTPTLPDLPRARR